MTASQQTLLLSQAYEPIKVISWQRALTLFTLGKVEVVEEYDGFVRSSTIVIKIPAVVRLLRAFRKHKKAVKFSRVNIYGRDNWKCQYCGAKKISGELTYDHVIPRAHGGKTTWDNIVTCCVDCNSRKGGRTPTQAGMKLLSTPVRPVTVPVFTIQIPRKNAPDAWRDYLYWTANLDEE